MPTYDYRCKACGHTFDEFQSITDKPLKKCPACGGAVERLLGTGSGIIFKGSGFYATDYRRGTPPPSSNRTAGNAAGKTDSTSAQGGSTDKGKSSGQDAGAPQK